LGLQTATGYQERCPTYTSYSYLATNRIAAVSIERNKSPDWSTQGELLEVLLAGDAADHLLDHS
jgi:hypothetical protein